MEPKLPHRGLTEQEKRVLLDAGWSMTPLDCMTPWWFDGREPKSYEPREAYEECVRRLRATREEWQG